ncbi:MAG: cytochrome c family protein, partial [Proteobacteria bacterium]|nr:cytochrome c family protein [Pseudomonadota bacterium]
MSTHSILCKSIVGISVVLLAIFSDSQENVRAESIDLSQHVPKRIGTDFRLGGPLSPFINENFIGSGRCANCHSILVDKNGKDMSIANHWRSTMMANAAKDPLWQAKVASEVSRNPALKEVIEKKCVSCHMPMAYRQENELPDKYKTDSKVGVFHAYLDRNSKLHEAAQDGVSCSLCHQIQDKGLGTEETFSGKFTIDMKTPAPDRKIFGPYRDPIRDTMKVSVGFDPAYGPQMNDSALCAACHMLYTPYVDSKGNVVGTFPEQTVYLEWLNSIYGEAIGKRHEISEKVGEVRLCQECHMPHSEDGGVVIAYYAPKEVQPKDHFSQHHFVGGNVFMLNILMDNLAVLDIRASQAKLADTRARTIAQLQKDTARISIAQAEQNKKRLTAEVQVENLVGHKFPSGIPIRRTWIHFTVKDSDGTIIFESGKPLADGSIAGNAADESSSGFEPHYAE